MVKRTWSAAVPPGGWGGPATVEILQWAERRRQHCSLPGPPPLHSSAKQSTRILSLESNRKQKVQKRIAEISWMEKDIDKGSECCSIAAQLLTTCCSCRQIRHIVQQRFQKTGAKSLLSWVSFSIAIVKMKASSWFITQRERARERDTDRQRAAIAV